MPMQERRTRIILIVLDFVLVLSMLLAISACRSGSETPTPAPAPSPSPAPAPAPPATNSTITISFSKDVQPIFNNYCVTCHQGQGPEQSNLTLEPRLSYGNLVGVASTGNPALMRVKAGAAGDSYLIAKVTGTQVAAGGKGAQMPYNAAPLTQAQIDLINQWINQGALNN